jgi:hypothetical protein
MTHGYFISPPGMTHHVPARTALGPFSTLHFLIFITTYAKMAIASSGVLSVDLVFPRNSTYAPTANFPIIFAFQNSHLAPFLDPLIHISAYPPQKNANGNTQYTPPESADLGQLRWANFTNNVNDTYFAYPTYKGYQASTFKFETEGIWQLTWTFNWANCTEGQLITRNSSDMHTTTLTIREGAQEVDLVAGTADESCDGQSGVAVNITNTIPIPDVVNWEGQGDRCASTSDDVPKMEPCRVSIDAAAATSISCEIGLATSTACPETKKGAAGRVTVGGFAALFAVLSFILH